MGHLVLVFDHSEQGAESIHSHFNHLHHTLASTRDPTQRLHRIMKEHFLKNSPENRAKIPAIKKRTKRAGN